MVQSSENVRFASNLTKTMVLWIFFILYTFCLSLFCILFVCLYSVYFLLVFTVVKIDPERVLVALMRFSNTFLIWSFVYTSKVASVKHLFIHSIRLFWVSRKSIIYFYIWDYEYVHNAFFMCLVDFLLLSKGPISLIHRKK